jgi:hypothetical protein
MKHDMFDFGRIGTGTVVLTDADDDEHEREGVHDGDQRLGKGRDDLPDRLDLAEEPGNEGGGGGGGGDVRHH